MRRRIEIIAGETGRRRSSAGAPAAPDARGDAGMIAARACLTTRHDDAAGLNLARSIVS
jgi:hypothetical protein